jgi:hypothetical protein
MSFELTKKILSGLGGYLGITVSHPKFDDDLEVAGITSNPAEYGWIDMPDEMRVEGRQVYCCRPVGSSADAIFVFADEVEIVDAPAYLIVGALMDRLHDINRDTARRLEDGEDDEVEGE